MGREYLTINPTGEFKSEKEFGDLLIVKQGQDKIVLLKDVANIRRGYVDPPSNILRVNGKRAVGWGTYVDPEYRRSGAAVDLCERGKRVLMASLANHWIQTVFPTR